MPVCRSPVRNAPRPGGLLGQWPALVQGQACSALSSAGRGLPRKIKRPGHRISGISTMLAYISLAFTHLPRLCLKIEGCPAWHQSPNKWGIFKLTHYPQFRLSVPSNGSRVILSRAPKRADLWPWFAQRVSPSNPCASSSTSRLASSAFSAPTCGSIRKMGGHREGTEVSEECPGGV